VPSCRDRAQDVAAKRRAFTRLIRLKFCRLP
jgi:hypothetical protein